MFRPASSLWFRPVGSHINYHFIEVRGVKSFPLLGFFCVLWAVFEEHGIDCKFIHAGFVFHRLGQRCTGLLLRFVLFLLLRCGFWEFDGLDWYVHRGCLNTWISALLTLIVHQFQKATNLFDTTLVCIFILAYVRFFNIALYQLLWLGLRGRRNNPQRVLSIEWSVRLSCILIAYKGESVDGLSNLLGLDQAWISVSIEHVSDFLRNFVQLLKLACRIEHVWL